MDKVQTDGSIGMDEQQGAIRISPIEICCRD